jgi:hypothetical protein
MSYEIIMQSHITVEIEGVMVKVTRAENLIQLMEWLKLGRRFYIHKDFLKYLEMSDIIRLCVTSKHYNKKYLNYCYNYFLSLNSNILHIIKNNNYFNNNTKPPMEEKINKKIYYVPKSKFYCWREVYCNYVELRKLYGKNSKITKMTDKYFKSISTS